MIEFLIVFAHDSFTITLENSVKKINFGFIGKTNIDGQGNELPFFALTLNCFSVLD